MVTGNGDLRRLSEMATGNGGLTTDGDGHWQRWLERLSKIAAGNGGLKRLSGMTAGNGGLKRLFCIEGNFDGEDRTV